MRRLLFILILSSISYTIFAQSEEPSDSVRISFGNHKPYGEFLIDMNLFKMPELPKITDDFMLGPDMRTDYNRLFQLDPGFTFTQGSVQMPFSTTYFYGMPWNSTEQLQMGTIRLNENVNLNLYGQYRADGRKVPNRSANPWEKKNFVGGMELKIKDFGIRIDVRQGYFPASYPY